MSIRHRPSPEEMRTRILDTAEEHFRRIGYAKTAVADIAAAMNMSPANIYRFFPSKSAINDALCGRIMRDVQAMMDRILVEPAPAALRFATLLKALNRHNREKLITENRLFDMVEVAMSENWPAIEEHCRAVQTAMARLIAEGIAAGEFRPVDPEATASAAFHASAAILDPALIARCQRSGSHDAETMVEAIASLLIAALKA